MLKDSEKYLKKMKELRKKIEERANEKTIEELYKDIFDLLKIIVGKKPQAKLIEEFDKNFVAKGKFPPHTSRILESVIDARKSFKQGKLNSHKVNETRKNGQILINDLIEYNQRCELANRKK